VNIIIIQDLISNIFNNEGPYSKSFKRRKKDLGYPHSNLSDETFAKIIDIQHPKFIVEVGSMVGNSAITMARESERHGETPAIVCIDPFTGDVNMWAWEKELIKNREWRFIEAKNGRSTIRQRFESNILREKLDKQIIPLEMTSIVGLKLLQRLHAENRISALPDCIYLDSAHELGETYIEAKIAFKTLGRSGILFGDDWSWAAVEHDITQFAKDYSLNINFIGNHWYIQKFSD
jgi:Methyltransferase domain